MALTNTYIDVAAADNYHTENNPGSAWDSATTPQKEAAIREATQYLENNFEFIGIINAADQPLEWPRDVTEDLRGREVETPYPKQVKDACAELALEALAAPLAEARSSKDDQIQRVKAGSVEVEYEEYASNRRSFPHVLMLLKSVIISSGSGVNVNVVRVQ